MNKSKKFMLVSIIALVITIIGSAGTYAWYVWNTSEDEQVKIVTNVGAATIYYDGGSEIRDAKLRPVSDRKNGLAKTISIKSSAATSQLKFNLYLDINQIDDDLKHESFRYALHRNDGSAPIEGAEGNFTAEYLNNNTSDCPVNEGKKHIQLLFGEAVQSTLTTYTLYIWIDGVNYENPMTMTNKSFDFTLHADGENAIIVEGKIPDITETIEGSFAYNLITMYNGAAKTDAFNNGIKYSLDYTNHLMSDIAGNLRYFGPDSLVNNYIYFNCDDYSNQTDETCEKWRIIGVFEGKLKIIRYSPIAELAWDHDKNQGSTSSIYDNNWEKSSLQSFLNTLYNNRGTTETYTYYSGSSGATGTTLNLTEIGITEATRNNNLISNSIWYLGAAPSANVYSNQSYEYERSSETVRKNNPFTLQQNVGLMYPSDYGYATDLSKCNKTLSDYDSSTNNQDCITYNWLYGHGNQWTITPTPSYSYRSWGITSAGKVLASIDVSTAANIRPVVYLNPEISVGTEGNGTKSTPYRIIIE